MGERSTICDLWRIDSIKSARGKTKATATAKAAATAELISVRFKAETEYAYA